MLLFSGTSNPKLSQELLRLTGSDPVEKELRRFPDGELYSRLNTDVSGETVILVQSTYPDENAMELFITSRMLKDHGADDIICVIPYFGYARQDRIFKEGESFTARTMCSLIEKNVDHVICVNLHKEATLNEFSEVKSARNVSVMREIGKLARELGVDFMLAPDKGAVPYAEDAATTCGCRFDHLEKTRIDPSTVKMAPKDLEVEGKSVCIVDDIIATGGTIMRASKALKEQGANSVYACCAHGLFTGGGRKKLEPELEGLYSSDTLEGPANKISAAPPIKEAIEEMIGD